ncbi:hypothetical protein [Streptosporangium sp. NPDC006007]|uniref:hypothetical protein n=1 Tax=Streptosporangium sp. NPDC006007 TaxID=3154575 RepID=UPI0033B1E208
MTGKPAAAAAVVLVVVAVITVIAVRALAARSGTQVHRINQNKPGPADRRR